MSISYRLDGMNSSDSLKEMSNFLKGARADVSFSGKRLVQKGGESIEIDALVKRITLIIDERLPTAQVFSLKDRIVGMSLQKRLVSVYKDSETRLEESGLLTQILNWVREFFSGTGLSDVRTKMDHFRAYSPSDYEQNFSGNTPEKTIEIAAPRSLKMQELVESVGDQNGMVSFRSLTPTLGKQSTTVKRHLASPEQILGLHSRVQDQSKEARHYDKYVKAAWG